MGNEHRSDGADADLLEVDGDTADIETGENQGELDTLEEAVNALGDDDEPVDEQTGEEEGDSDADDQEADDETDADPDFDTGDEVLVTMSDGEQLPLGELKKGYFRAKDYTHKTEEVARERDAVEALRSDYVTSARSLQNAYQGLVQFLGTLIPAEPSPELARTDPGAYTHQKALRENAIAEVQKVYAQSQNVDVEIDKAGQADIARYKADEDTKLLKVMPALKEPGRRAAFDAANKKTAVEFGFSEQEISATADHRLLQLVHYARLGKIAEQNRKNAARRVGAKPQKGERGSPAGKQPRNRTAMNRLMKTGSIEDAMQIDFD